MPKKEMKNKIKKALKIEQPEHDNNAIDGFYLLATLSM